MRSIGTRFVVVVALVVLLSAQVLAYSDGPPEQNMTGDATALGGCNCHGTNAPASASGPSTDVIVSIAGVPYAYQADTDYDLTVKVESAGNTAGGFMLSAGGVGTFSWSEDANIRPAKGSDDSASATSTNDNISHSDTTDPAEWAFTWTAPSSDVGDVAFYLVGNSVDGGGANDANDHWNILAFSITSPSSSSPQSDTSTRFISVGDYASLFESEPDADAIEHERQVKLAASVLNSGNTLYFSTLCALIVGAVFQREAMERRRGEGPAWLAPELAYPQGLRRSLVAIGAFLLGLYWMSNGEGGHMWGSAIFIGFWASYGVYRTVLAVRREPEVKDVE